MDAVIKTKQGNAEGDWGLLWSEYSGKTSLGGSLGGDLNDKTKEPVLLELRTPSSFLSFYFSFFSFIYLLFIHCHFNPLKMWKPP